MKNHAAFLAAVVLVAASSAYALYSVANEGKWPATWPAQLEPLRTQSRTLVGPMVEQRHYEIPFTSRDQFESAWPHILEVKSKGAPIVLMRAPDAMLVMKIAAGVRIHCPPADSERKTNPEIPIAGVTNVRERWMNTNYIDLIVDGSIVDLNRIPLPADTPIIDERFTDELNKAPKPTAK
jgi:hypothetical protein